MAKNKIILALLLALVLTLTGCTAGLENDPVTNGYFGDVTIYESNPITLVDDARVWIEFRADLDYVTVTAQGKPTLVQYGAFSGFSLPIYAADNEELFLDICVPDRWDGVSDIEVHIDCWIDTAQVDVTDAFRLRILYANVTTGVDTMPAITTTLNTQTTTGIAPQFQTYQVSFTIPATNIDSDDMLAFILRRVAVVGGTEITGEVVINHVGVIFRCDKLGNITAK